VKCIHCAKDCKYSERPDKKCPHCKHLFAFEPRQGDPFTDGLMQSAIEMVSAKGTIRFGSEHVYYEVCRRLHRKFPFWLPPLLIGGLAVVLAFFLPSPARWIVSGFLAFAAVASLLVARQKNTVAVIRPTFDRLWQRWCEVHGTPKGLIVRKEIPTKPPKLEADVADYSFDRAVVCDSEGTVDLLLANQFHFENNCAVLSIDGYPPGIFTLVRAMLKRNPQLQVFVLHDATAKGCRLAHKLAADPEWFGPRIKVIDVGLRPIHANAFKGLWTDPGREVKPGDGISAEEAIWLSAHSLALAAVRPEQVLKRLFRAINRQFDPHAAYSDSGGNGGNTGTTDNASFAADAGDTDGGADAFG
jgi:hypothetical protein